MPAREWYRSADVLDAERRLLFAGSWALVAAADELRAPGAYVSVSVGDIPLVVVRDGSGALRAFHNVCRHRGMPLVEGNGNLDRFLTCPYHDWRYSLDGRLVRVPQEATQFCGMDRAAWGLMPAQVAEWQGMVFANPAAGAPALAEAMAGLDDRLAPFLSGPLVEVARVRHEARCNWKLLVENHVDVYHLWYLHRRSLRSFAHRSFRWESLGDNWWSHEPLRDPSQAPAGLPWLGDDDRGGIGAHLLFPNLMIVTTGDYFATYDAVPLAPDRTSLTLRVRSTAGTEPDPLVEAVRSFMAEDVAACERLQEATASPTFALGPLARTHEAPVRRFQASVRLRLHG
jgi:Rieske 2Fe-2S family protein